MKRANKRIIFLASVLFVLNSASAFAISVRNLIPRQVWDILRYFFEILPGSAERFIYFKFLIWMLVFSLLRFGANKLFKDSQKTANIVALIVSLMGTLLIPAQLLEYVFRQYAMLVSIVVVILPVFIGFYLNLNVLPKDGGWQLLRGLLFFIIGTFALGASAIIASSFGGTAGRDIAEWISVGAGLCYVAGIFTLFSGWGLGAKAGNFLSNIRGGGRGPGPGRGPGAGRQPAARAQQNDQNLAALQQGLQNIGNQLENMSAGVPPQILNVLRALRGRVNEIQGYFRNRPGLESLGRQVCYINAMIAAGQMQPQQWPQQSYQGYYGMLQRIHQAITDPNNGINALVQTFYGTNLNNLTGQQQQMAIDMFERTMENYFQTLANINSFHSNFLTALAYNTTL